MRKTTGLSLLLLIFLSLCLIIFSLLSLSGATADETLSQKTADRTQEYYTAVSEANLMLASIDDLLAEELRNAETYELQKNKLTAAETADIYLQNCALSLETHFPDCITVTDSSICLTFSAAITDSQILQVSLYIDYPLSPEDTLYQITEWKVINTATWTPDLSQNVYIP